MRTLQDFFPPLPVLGERVGVRKYFALVLAT